MDTPEAPEVVAQDPFTAAEIGALAHLYRGEVYRSTIWRTRLDATTNWSVVTLGIALSISYASPSASPLPLLLVGFLIAVFLYLEARRYRYFNVWRARCRWMETHFYAPLLQRESYQDRAGWQTVLAKDYIAPQHHISFVRAFGRRLRRNYMWILGFQALAYFGKIIIHPTPIQTLHQFWRRMDVGPIAGEAIFAATVVFHLTWAVTAIYAWRLDRAKHGPRRSAVAMG